MGNKASVTTQIRIPEEMHTELKALSADAGNSLNATMLNLIYLGLRMYRDAVILYPQDNR